MNEEISIQELSDEESNSSKGIRGDIKEIHESESKSSLVKGIKHRKEINKKAKTLKNEKEFPKQCRICLEGQEEGRMICPCACLGSVAYTHEKCITQWILHKINTQNKNILNGEKVICEICQIPFNYNSMTRRYLDLEIFRQNYLKYSKSYYVFGIVEIILLVITIAILFIIIKSDEESEFGLLLRETFMKKENLKSVYISIATAILVMVAFLLILFLVENAVKSDEIISEIYGYSNFQSSSVKQRNEKTFLPQEVQIHFEN